ncbi:CpaD family pilus assembly lipoprotein [Hyphobacterium sp.]|uniref:CpaD family pilus assembly lipoprotein n=1 Tax=Hyphobacterium sp. TaxID=2004662 RepID=UPI003BAA4318
MKFSTLALVLAPALLTAACASYPATTNAIGFPEARPVLDTARMDLLVDPAANGLLWSQMGAFGVFVDHYKSNGHGPIILSYPDGGAEDRAAQGAMAELRNFLDSQGVTARYTEEGPYDATGMGNPPVIVSYLHYVTEMPAECSERRWDDLARERLNDGYSGFGCFMAQNRAAMIGDPYHLAGPTDHDAPDQARRQTVLDTYRRGEPTATQRREDESGAVSSAVD